MWRSIRDPNLPSTGTNRGGYDPGGFDYIGREPSPPSSKDSTSGGFNFDQNKDRDKKGGISTFQPPQTNIAQQVLGSHYNTALNLGYKPSELVNQVNKAMKYERAGPNLNIDRFKNQLDLASQGTPSVGPDGMIRYQFTDKVVRDPTTGKQILSILKPELTANPAANMGEVMSDVKGAFSSMFEGAKKIPSNILEMAGKFSPWNMVFGGQKPGEYIQQFIGTPEQRDAQKQGIMALSDADRRRFNELIPSMGADAAMARIAYENRFLSPSGFAFGGIASL